MCVSVSPLSVNLYNAASGLTISHWIANLSTLTAARLITDARAVNILTNSLSLQTAPPLTSCVSQSCLPVTTAGQCRHSVSNNCQDFRNIL